MAISRILIGILFIFPMLSACGPSDRGEVAVDRITMGINEIHVHAPNSRDATISREGYLRIGSREIPLSPSQKSLLQRYYNDAVQTRADGKDVGLAGAKMGGAAIGTVVTKLFGGQPDKKKLEAGSTEIQQKVTVLCNHLADLEATQRQAGESIPAFKPYANIKFGDCRQDHGDSQR